MRAGTAELALIGIEPDSRALVSRVNGVERFIERRVGVEHLGHLWKQALDSGCSILATNSSRDESVRSNFASLGHEDVLIVPLSRRSSRGQHDGGGSTG